MNKKKDRVEQAMVEMDFDGTHPREVRGKKVDSDVQYLFDLYQKSLLTKLDIEMSDKSETLVG